MTTFGEKLTLFFKEKNLLKRVGFVAGALVVFRLLATIPIPGVDLVALERLFETNQFLGLMNLFSGSGLTSLSIVMLGVGPYITASIIMQLLTMMSEKLKALYHEEGEAGRKRFSQYSRLLTVPLSLIQGFGFLVLLQNQGVLPGLSQFDIIMNVLIVTGGSVLLMWIGELMTEYGIGNGTSLIIFAGIVSQVPGNIGQLAFSFDPSQIPIILGFLVAGLVVIWGVVVITEAERPIPITYAKRVRGNKIYGGVSTYLPIRMNQAGVIPIIFALSILLFPQMILGALSAVDNGAIQGIVTFLNAIITNQILYAVLYFIMVFLFTFFYTAVTFDPHAISTNLQKSGAFIPGVRPGVSTEEYVSHILTRTTFVGALFLGVIAVLPLVMKSVTGINALAIGGTGLLIVISVVIDFVKKVDAQLTMKEY